MAAMTYEVWKNSQSSDLNPDGYSLRDLNPDGYSLNAYNQYLTGMGLAPVSSTDGTSYSPSSSATTLNVDNTTYQRPAGIPAYNGYQPPNYGNTTPNTTHWLNTMNAFAPTARTDMERLLGQGGGGSSGGMAGGGMTRAPSPMTGSYRPDTGWQTGNTQGAYTPTGPLSGSGMTRAPSTGLLGGPVQPAAMQPATQPAAIQPTNQFPTEWTQNSAPGYMDAFWNVPGSAYAPPGTQTQQQPAYSQPASTQQSSWSNGTVGINPATGSLTFL